MDANEILSGEETAGGHPSATVPILVSYAGATELIGAWAGFGDADETEGDEIPVGDPANSVAPAIPMPGEIGEGAEEIGGVAEEPDRLVPEVPAWVAYGGLGAITVAFAVFSNPPIDLEEEDRAVLLFSWFVIFLIGIWLQMMYVVLMGIFAHRR